MGKNPILRVADVPDGNGYKRVINNIFLADGIAYGNLCLFTPGQMQALIELYKTGEHGELNDTIEAFTIAESGAPDGHEYVHGIAYWMAIGDHFYQIQHPAIQVKASEEYFTWFLRDCSKVIGADKYVELIFKFDREQVGDDLGGVLGVEIGGVIPETVSAVPDEPENVRVQKEDIRQRVADGVAAQFGKAKAILVDLFGDVRAQELIDAVPAEAALEVKVNIGYVATRTTLKRELMTNLARGMRNIPDGELRVRGRDGFIQGEDARLSQDMQIETVGESSSLLDMQNVAEQMLEVHRRFLHDGKVTEN